MRASDRSGYEKKDGGRRQKQRSGFVDPVDLAAPD